MAESLNAKVSETLDKYQDKNVMKSGSESIDDSGIEMSEEKEKIDPNSDLNCPWILGQLAWARGSSYPFWPCVVTLDPKTMLYYRIQNKGRSQALMVHVQYFGDGGRHNWVLSHYMMPFSGLDDFQNRAKSVTPETKKKDPKYTAAFFPKLGVKKQWGIGVTEASGLMNLSNEERASIFEPVIHPPEQTAQPTQNKLKRKLSTRGSKVLNDAPIPGQKRFKNTESEDQAGKLLSSSEPAPVTVSQLGTGSSSDSTSALKEESIQNITISSRRKSTRNQNKSSKEVADVPKRQLMRKKVPKLSEEEKRRRDEIDFEDYYNLNKNFWKADHPHATDEEIRKLLEEMWNGMDAEEKTNNLNRNFDDYRHNSTTDQSEVKRPKQKTLQLEKENSKNTENAQPENNKNISKLNGKNDEDSFKKNPENEKITDVSKTNGSPQKEKSKAITEVSDDSQDDKAVSQNGENQDFEIKENPQKAAQKDDLKANSSPKETAEKSKTVSETNDDSKDNKSGKNSKSEIVSKSGNSEDSEMKDNSQKDVEKEHLEQNGSTTKPKEKVYNSSLKRKKFAPKASEKNTKVEVEAAEKGEEKNQKMEVKETKATDKDVFLRKNRQKEKA